MENRTFPAKLLLFGEYTVLVGSRALAIPVPHWSGSWERGTKVDASLALLVEHLVKSGCSERLKLESLRGDINGGLYFKSSIPQGYGLGSSAALTAAIFNDYGSEANNLQLTELVKELASLESYYHGQSSGLDPLVSYLNCPVLHENGANTKVHLMYRTNSPRIFLINSGIARFTAPLVTVFKSKLSDPYYVNEVVRPLKVNVDHAIANFLSGSWEVFWEYLQLISEAQLDSFKEMLPESIEHIWKIARHNPGICLKLCGAGGGGYFLGFARQGIDIEQELGCTVELIETPG